MDATWITKVPPREEKPLRQVPCNQINRVSAIMMFRAASGLGLFDAKQLIDINFPHHLQPQPNTLEIQALGSFIAAWRLDNLRGFV